jgi:hypothetical protein
METRWRESGRLAEKLGDRKRAIREYETYLSFRTNEDDEGKIASQPVRDALARLLSESERK